MPGKRLNTSQSEGALSVNSRLSASRREKLINLKKREDLKDALMSKFQGRFGHGSKDKHEDEVSLASTTIRREVDHFAEKANVTEANLGRLERRLVQKAVPRPGDTASMVSGYSGTQRSVASLAGQNVINGGNPGGEQTYSWTRLDQYASYLHEQDSLRQRLGVHALQKKLRMDLDQQLAEKRKREMDQVEEDKHYHVNTMLDLDRWKEQQKIRDAEKHAKIMQEKGERDTQLAFEKKLRDEALQKKKEEESSLVEKIVTEMEVEQRRFEKKKAQTKKAMRKVFEENQMEQEKANEEKKKAQVREAQAIKDAQKAMEKQEEQRQAEMNARIEKQNNLMKSLQDNMDGIKKETGDNDAQRANAQQDEMDRHFFEAESMKQSRLKAMRLENQSYLLKQMDEKNGRKAEDNELTAIQARILQHDSDEYADLEKQKVDNRRKLLVENRKEVERQMAIKLQQSVPVMSEHEIAINRPLLNLVDRTLANNYDPMPGVAADEYED